MQGSLQVGLIRWLVEIFLGTLLLAGGLGCAADRPVRIKVMSFNMQHGVYEDDAIDLKRVAKVIRSQKPDIVCLLEEDVFTERSGRVGQMNAVAKLTRLTPVFGKAIDYQGGDYGNAVLTRYPVKDQQTYPIPMQSPGEARVILETRVAVSPTQTIRVLSTHFDHRIDQTERARAAREVTAVIRRDPRTPAILGGDLNADPDSPALDHLREDWIDAAELAGPTYPRWEPVERLDYILARPVGSWRILDARVVKGTGLSDHLPVVVELEYVGAGYRPEF